MATSSSIDLDLTARQVVEFALHKINLLATGQAVEANIAARALTELEVMLKEWMKHPSIWLEKEGYVLPLANTASYSLTPRPYRVTDCRFRTSSGTDIAMYELTRQEYYDLPNKGATGTPTQWFFDPQRATSSLFIWPVLSSVTTQTIRVTYQRRIEDIDDLGNEIDVPQEHLSLVGFNLAARLADNFGKNGTHVDRIIARAGMLLESAMDADRPQMIRFCADHRNG